MLLFIYKFNNRSMNLVHVFSNGISSMLVRCVLCQRMHTCEFVCLFIGIKIGFRLWHFNQHRLVILARSTVYVCVCRLLTHFTVQLETSGSKAIPCKGLTAFSFLFILCSYAVLETTTTYSCLLNTHAENIIIPIIIVCLKSLYTNSTVKRNGEPRNICNQPNKT